MRIIHTGDIHIGSPLKNLPPEKAQLRKTEILDGFRRLCAYAKDNAVTVVLIAGDLLDGNRVTRQTKRQVLSFMESASPVCFFVVSGNHDSDGLEGETVPQNVYLFTQTHGAQAYRLPENVTITGMDTKYFSTTNFDALRFAQDTFNILLLHGDVYTEQSREYIPLNLLQNKGVDYLALGHIHKPTAESLRLDSRGKYRYCGCLEGRGFDEIGPRGFFLLTVEKTRITDEKFLTFATRETVELRLDISACNSYYELENAAISALQKVSEKNLVKLVLCGRYKAGLRKDLPLLSARLSARCFHLKIEDISRILLNPKDYETDLTERGEFVREVGRYEMSEELREEILQVGLQALNGEEIDL
jgi:DNA repair exonuclease SbcCD nuclease subunit